MAEDVYTLRLEDEVSATAKRAAAAYETVAAAAKTLAAAAASGDRAQTTAARGALRVANAQFGAARAALTAGSAMLRLQKNYNAAATGADRGAKSTKQFSYVLNGLATAAGNAGFNLAGKLGRGLLDVAGGLWETAELASRSRMSLNLLYGGMAEGQAAQAKALEMSRRYGLNLELVLATLNQFKSAGFDLGQSSALLQLGADMRALGSTDGQLESVFLALRKIQSQSFLQGDELNMLSEAGVSVDKIYTRLQAKLGKTREEIIKMQGTRQLAAGDVLNAIAEATLVTAGKTKFGQAGEEAANATLGGIKSRLTSNLSADLFEATQRAEPALVKGMQAILGGALGADGKTLQDQLTTGLIKIGQGLESLGPRLPGLIDNLGRVADTLGKILELITRDATKGNASGIGLIDYDPAKIAENTGIPGFLRDVWTSATSGRNDPYAAGKSAGEGFAQGLADTAPTVATAAANVAQGVVDASKSQLEIKSPSRVMAEQGAFVAEGLAMGIEDQADIAMRASSVMAQGVVEEAGGVLAPSSGALAAGSAAGDSYASSSASTSNRPVIHFDVHLGGGIGPQDDPVQQLRDFIELEVASIFERHLEGTGA